MTTRFHKSLFALAVVGSALAPRVAAAEPRAVAREGGGLTGLSVDVELASHKLLVTSCAKAEPCHEPSRDIPIPGGLTGELTAIAEEITLGEGRHLVHVKIAPKEPGARGVAWEALLAGTTPTLVWEDFTGLARGEEGEHTGFQLSFHPSGESQVVILGDVREDVRLCGQALGTPLGPKMLDPKTLTWRPVGLQRLSATEREAARSIDAVPSSGPVDKPLAPLLVAVGSSTGVSGGALVDADLRTSWVENRNKDGRGEFVALRSPVEVPIARFSVVPAPEGTPRPPGGASPRVFFLATDGPLFKITLPEDAWEHPGRAYGIALPEPVKTSCVALVLEEAYTHEPSPDVMVAELTAYSELDAPGATFEALANGLSGPHAAAAAALLRRAGEGALEAVDAAYDKLDAEGRARAVEVAIGQPSCERAAPVLVKALARSDDENARRARAKVERCGKAATAPLVLALADEKHRARVAPVLAQVDPVAAVGPLTQVLGAGPHAAKVAVRTSLTRALRRVPLETVRALVSDASGTVEQRVERVRAAEERLRGLEAEADKTLDALLAPGAEMATRYRLVPAVAALARAGDKAELARLSAMATSDADWQVRARAAEESSSLEALSGARLRAARDPEPRVREAALGASGAELATVAAELLVKDGWTFVRVAAVAALTKAPPSEPLDRTLTTALGKDTAARVRGAAAVALGMRHARVATDALRERAADAQEETEVRAASVEALAELCDAGSLDLLTRLAKAAAFPTTEAQARVGSSAVGALARLHPRDLASRLAPLLAPGVPRGAERIAKQALASQGTCGR